MAELAERRRKVAEKIGAKSVLVMFGGEPRVYTNDVSYEFRMENNLFYLTHLKQQGATLVLMPGSDGPKEILFIPRRNPAAETWTGHMYSPEEARRISGVNEIWEAKEFEPFVRALRTRQPYRPQVSGVLYTSVTQAVGTAQPVTPPVPKSDQTPEAASAPRRPRAPSAATRPPTSSRRTRPPPRRRRLPRLRLPPGKRSPPPRPPTRTNPRSICCYPRARATASSRRSSGSRRSGRKSLRS